MWPSSLVTIASSSARAEIRIGIATPLTGHYAWAGEQTEPARMRRSDDLNGRGGLLGETLVAVTVDDFCDPDQAMAAAQKLVAEGVPFVVGHQCSGAAIPASTLYEEEGIILISPAATNPRLTDRGLRYTFRTSGRDDLQGRMVADYLAEEWAGANIAVVHDGQAYGEGIAEETRRRLDELNIETALLEQVEPGQTEFSDLIAAFETSGIDVVFYGGYQSEAGLIIRQAKARLPELGFVVPDGVASEDFWLIAGQAAEGTPMTCRRRAAARSCRCGCGVQSGGYQPDRSGTLRLRARCRRGRKRSSAPARRMRPRLPTCCAGSSSTPCSARSASMPRATSPASTRSPGTSGRTAGTYRRI